MREQNADPLGENAHSWVCCLSQWSNVGLIIAYNNPNSIKITIWLILDNIEVYST